MTYLVIWAEEEGSWMAREASIQEACEWLTINQHDLLWAIEEYGRCDGISATGQEVVVIEREFTA